MPFRSGAGAETKPQLLPKRRLPFTNEATLRPGPLAFCSVPAGARRPGSAPDAQRQAAPPRPTCEVSPREATLTFQPDARGEGPVGFHRAKATGPKWPSLGQCRAGEQAGVNGSPMADGIWEPGWHQRVTPALGRVIRALGILSGPPGLGRLTDCGSLGPPCPRSPSVCSC